MLTLTPHKENVVIAHMRSGKKIVPIMWHPVVKEELRNSVDDLGTFFTQDFRDRFKIHEYFSLGIKPHAAGQGHISVVVLALINVFSDKSTSRPCQLSVNQK